MLNLPNMLSLLRLALLPFMVVLFLLPFEWAAWTCFVLYVIGALTDFLDGWIARKFNQTSEFGAFIDPVSDKMFVVTILLMLVATERIEGLYVLAVVIIILREFLVSGLREYLGPKNIKLPVTKLAKWKTATQMAALGVLIVAPYVAFGSAIGLLLLLTASGLTIITGWLYLKAGLEHMKRDIIHHPAQEP
ncbi:MAG: CDP-diacylglycerol--glycerol-3-phosphate 3-phosphatidyltransferase [Alphaproteobacteria bacterium]|nr:CDP-diacylglycerol--glycerol-3-phosphate 3-phosphatidyltransferase [Alphaproteobacteria bacterium]